MHVFYLLATSGLLLLTEIPAEQPPPQALYQVVHYAVTHAETQINSDGEGRHENVTFVPSSYATDLAGEWHYTSSPITYLGISNNTLPIQAKQVHFEARQPPQVAGVRLQDGPEIIPVEIRVSPTPFPKSTTLPTVAVVNQPTATPALTEPTTVPSATPPVAPHTTSAEGALATYRQQSTLPIAGYAMFYNPNVMQVVLNNRLAMGQVSACGECVGNVALLRAGDLNRRVWLQWADGTVEGPFLVADVAASHHVAQLLARNWVVDVDNRTAVRRSMAGPVWVTVWGAPPTGQAVEAPPFAPLYSTMPTPMPTAISANAAVAPTVTPLPAIHTPMTTMVMAQSGFPTDTPVPTLTPLPALSATPTPTVVSVPATYTPLPTLSPSPTVVAPTVPVTPTSLPLVTVAVSPTATSVVTQGGFPADTPMPTITPLPALTPTPTSPATPTATVTPLPTAAATMTVTLAPTTTVSTSPSSATVTQTVTHTVTQNGFPPDTPVPTITPLPAINPLPTPTVTPNPN